MPEYRVRWEITVEAKSVKAAAEEALRIHRDPASIATVFDVQPLLGRRWNRVDLTPEADHS